MNRRSVSRRIATVGLAEPLPQLTGLSESGSAESSYYTWVDQFNTLGLGENVPINTGNESEGLLALRDGEWVILRVPYPLGFYTKWMDGRIDDADAGWKGRGLWATYSTRAPFHLETFFLEEPCRRESDSTAADDGSGPLASLQRFFHR